MKPHCTNQRTTALTLVEVVIIIAILAVLATIGWPVLRINRREADRTSCVNNPHPIGLAFKLWEGQSGLWPMHVSVKGGGAMESASRGNIVPIFQVVSNELNTPKILICPADTNRVAAANFSSGFDNKNVSYFVGVDADTVYPGTILSGDDNFSVGGNQVKSGLLELLTNTSVSWTGARHEFASNILLADGEVLQPSRTNLQQVFQQTGLATNRLAIP